MDGRTDGRVDISIYTKKTKQHASGVFNEHGDNSKMKHDFSVSHSDLEGQSDGAVRHNDDESAVSPQKSVRSAKSSVTQDTYNTGNSKHSTTEDELRSLSTTPRYSHEDLGTLFFS